MVESSTLSTQRQSRYEWVLGSENWEYFVIICIPQVNMTPVENNYTNLLIKEIESTYFQHRCCERSHQRRSK